MEIGDVRAEKGSTFCSLLLFSKCSLSLSLCLCPHPLSTDQPWRVLTVDLSPLRSFDPAFLPNVPPINPLLCSDLVPQS